MHTNQADDIRDSSIPGEVLIALFSDASDARSALTALRDHTFGLDQVGAAFREPHSAGRDNSSAVQQSGLNDGWFNQLREIYRGDVPPERTRWAPAEFEASLSQLHIPAQQARLLVQDLAPGGAIVTVNPGNRYREAEQLLRQSGGRIARDPIERNPPAKEERVPRRGPTAPAQSSQPSEPDHIQLFGEVLRVHKEKVGSGDVRVRKEAVTEMETVQVPVTREHLVVEHTGANSPVDATKPIRIPLSEERVRVDKDTVLQEEYRVGKREVTENETVTDAVRRERLLVDTGETDADRPNKSK
jgi:uncharacterized protein (TIGR02271 family)